MDTIVIDTIAVRKIDGSGRWADVVAIIRDLKGFKIVVWQDRTGTVGAMKMENAMLRIN